MTAIGIPPRTPQDWDVPAAEAADQFMALKRRRLADGVAAEARHLIDPFDRVFAALASASTARCSCDADYPGWTPGRTS
ncbi:hypothetical protein [Streptomyces scopuliridis]|uniref:hypothetical protein n=1 Tax=Streptomyces scopuliridis TaxID=452529 RepID=UPI0035DFB0E3